MFRAVLLAATLLDPSQIVNSNAMTMRAQLFHRTRGLNAAAFRRYAPACSMH